MYNLDFFPHHITEARAAEIIAAACKNNAGREERQTDKSSVRFLRMRNGYSMAEVRNRNGVVIASAIVEPCDFL